METLESIFTRRSVRRYTADPVDETVVETLLRAAMSAPSAGNAQPWHFIVVRSREMLKRITDIHPYAQMSKQAAGAILVCADPALEHYPGFWPQDCSAATQNILLAARAQNLGAVWCGITPDERRMAAFRELFQLPATIMPFSLIPFGHTDMIQSATDRFSSDRVHAESW